MSSEQDEAELRRELAELRRRVAGCEQTEAEWRRTEAALRESQRRLSTLLSNLPGMAYRCRNDADWTMVFVSQGCARLTGYAVADLLQNRAISWRALIHPDDRSNVYEDVQRAIGEQRPFEIVYRIRTAWGEERWVWERGVGVPDDSGRVEFLEGLVADISERVQVERELERRVAARTAELAEANQRLREENAERTRAQEAVDRERRTLWHMLRASDHERQLIAYDIHDGLAQQLAAAVIQFQAYEQAKGSSAGNARAAYNAGVQMVRQAHFEARRLISGVRPPILDESGVVAALGHLAHDQQIAGGPEIEFQSDVQFVRLESILENAIYRIAQEALANACHHSQSPRIRLSLVQHGDSVQLDVEDWGVGFDPAAVDAERFGLEGIRERARLLGGQVGVESRAGEGTRVKVVLPLVSSTAPAGP
ncbi:MAG: PAS domain-containing protein [Pirellulales bacterium]|jgi:PAS domain S-box-containing protein|nr:PAS domain-containing protein [Thermoguttaceae bacterium]MDD4786055.1 PAS domain-containing protein [Pirellulales bacterium]MDI9444655.1 PAS domain-containing protein [Planctomycetota bacterium]NLZ03229.1 PAS domain-containing protein [Pirellulaceae bacterium]